MVAIIFAKVRKKNRLLKTQKFRKNTNSKISDDFQYIKNLKWDFMYFFGKSY